MTLARTRLGARVPLGRCLAPRGTAINLMLAQFEAGVTPSGLEACRDGALGFLARVRAKSLTAKRDESAQKSSSGSSSEREVASTVLGIRTRGVNRAWNNSDHRVANSVLRRLGRSMVVMARVTV